MYVSLGEEVAVRLLGRLRSITRLIGTGKELTYLAVHRDTSTAVSAENQAEVNASFGNNALSNRKR